MRGNEKMRLIRLMVAFAALCIAIPANAQPPAATTAAAQLAALLQRYQLVALGERHGSERFHRFLQGLLRDPVFVCALDDIVVEFGNAAFQETADRYVSGQEVPRAEFVRIWRDTGQWLVWDSPIYERVFERVREINAARMCPRPLRILLADPPILWPAVRSAADYRRFQRDEHAAAIVERHVLAPGRRALVIMGEGHVHRRRAPTSQIETSFAQLIERRRPGVLYTIQPLYGRPDEMARLGLAEERIVPVAQTPFAGRSYGALVPNAAPRGWANAEDVVDAFVPLPGSDRYVPPDWRIYREPDYQRALRRRARILREVFGTDYLAQLEAILARPL